MEGDGALGEARRSGAELGGGGGVGVWREGIEGFARRSWRDGAGVRGGRGGRGSSSRGGEREGLGFEGGRRQGAGRGGAECGGIECCPGRSGWAGARWGMGGVDEQEK